MEEEIWSNSRRVCTGTDSKPLSYIIECLNGGTGVSYKSHIMFDLKRECGNISRISFGDDITVQTFLNESPTKSSLREDGPVTCSMSKALLSPDPPPC